MTYYVEVAVNVPKVTGSFHYHLPEELLGKVEIGHLVVVPFGKQRVQGVILRFVDQPEVQETKAVQSLVDEQVVLTPGQIELAQYLADEYLAPVSSCIGLMVPVGLMQQADVIYTAVGHEPGRLTKNQRRLWQLLKQQGPLRGTQLDRKLKHINWRSSARSLVNRGLVTTRSELSPPKVRPKRIRTVQLACPPQKAVASLPSLGRPGSQALERRQSMLQFVIHEPGPVNVSWVYAESGGSLSDLRKLNDLGLVAFGESEEWRDPIEDYTYVPSEPPKLTRDQQQVWEIIREKLYGVRAAESNQPLLLHGVTGSGKTEIYLRAVETVLDMGRDAIVMVPEISLTPQTVKRFISRFPGTVGLIHSRLSPGERYDTWRRARAGQLKVIIGPRSALFAPLKNPGIVILDESHDGSYYQSDPIPRYQSRCAAVLFARINAAVCLFGSATPDVTSVYECQQGNWEYLRLPSRILAHKKTVESQLKRLGKADSNYKPFEGQAQVSDLPHVEVIDMRSELKSGNRSIFSRRLALSLERVTTQGEQAILFLNRRGTATYVFCRDCGHSMKCPRCEIPFTYHRSPEEYLLCHHCGYRRSKPARCPVCKSERIRHFGTGTEQVENEVQKLFPGVRTLRWDYETTRKKDAHRLILERFVSRGADVLIGTQMLAKGLDLPYVTLVGVILADVGLNLPDYRANERTFQVLSQVAGRAGRSPLGGEVLLQTFQPDHYVIQSAAQHDYKEFFQKEMEYRRKLVYPPITSLVRLEYRHLNIKTAEAEAHRMAASLKNWAADENRRATRITGPVPCFFERVGGMYRWQIIVRGPDPVSLLRARSFGEWRISVNPTSLL